MCCQPEIVFTHFYRFYLLGSVQIRVCFYCLESPRIPILFVTDQRLGKVFEVNARTKEYVTIPLQQVQQPSSVSYDPKQEMVIYFHYLVVLYPLHKLPTGIHAKTPVLLLSKCPEKKMPQIVTNLGKTYLLIFSPRLHDERIVVVQKAL